MVSQIAFLDFHFRLWGRPWCQRHRQEIWNKAPASSSRRDERSLHKMWQCKISGISVVNTSASRHCSCHRHLFLRSGCRRRSTPSGRLRASWPLKARPWPTAPTKLRWGTSSPSCKWRAWRPLLARRPLTWRLWRWMLSALFRHAMQRNTRPSRLAKEQ